MTVTGSQWNGLDCDKVSGPSGLAPISKVSQVMSLYLTNMLICRVLYIASLWIYKVWMLRDWRDMRERQPCVGMLLLPPILLTDRGIQGIQYYVAIATTTVFPTATATITRQVCESQKCECHVQECHARKCHVRESHVRESQMCEWHVCNSEANAPRHFGAKSTTGGTGPKADSGDHPGSKFKEKRMWWNCQEASGENKDRNWRG